MSEVIIRPSRVEDMSGVMSAHRRSIVELCSKDYSAEQIAFYSDVNYSKDIWQNSVLNDYHIVIEKEGRIEGFIHACVLAGNVGEITGLYFTNAIAGQGYGRKVFEQALVFLQKNNCKKIIITGTKTARPFYEKMGFTCVKERVIHLRGVDLLSYSMETYL